MSVTDAVSGPTDCGLNLLTMVQELPAATVAVDVQVLLESIVKLVSGLYIPDPPTPV